MCFVLDKRTTLKTEPELVKIQTKYPTKKITSEPTLKICELVKLQTNY